MHLWSVLFIVSVYLRIFALDFGRYVLR